MGREKRSTLRTCSNTPIKDQKGGGGGDRDWVSLMIEHRVRGRGLFARRKRLIGMPRCPRRAYAEILMTRLFYFFFRQRGIFTRTGCWQVRAHAKRPPPIEIDARIKPRASRVRASFASSPVESRFALRLFDDSSF